MKLRAMFLQRNIAVEILNAFAPTAPLPRALPIAVQGLHHLLHSLKVIFQFYTN